MKQRIVFIILIFTLGFNLVISSDEVDRKLEETPEFLLQGRFNTDGLRSGGDVITAEIKNDIIIALFNKDVGNLLVIITNGKSEIVYEATVNTSVQQQVIIPLSGLPSGTYTITYNNDRGEMWGDFKL